MQAVPPAKAAAAAARWEYHTTYQDMGRVIRFAKEDFEHSPELQEAVAAEAEAYAAYDSARRQALAPLADDLQYQTFLRLADDLQRDMENLRATPKPPENELLAMAAVKLNYTTRARDKEVLLLEESDDYKRARTRLVEASTRVSRLRGQFDRSLRRNEQVAQLRDQLQENRIAKVAAEAYARSTEEVADVAINFAYYVNRDSAYLNSYNSLYRSRYYYPPYIKY